MKRMSLLALGLVSVLAMTVLLAGGASAKEAKKDLVTFKTAKGVLPAGAKLKATSSNLIFVTSSGNLECSSNILEGEVAVNNAKKDKGPITAESSTGSETLEGKSGACKTTTPLGSTIISTSKLPWEAVFTDKGVSEVKGKKVTFTSLFASGVTCIFEASKVKSSFNTSGPVVIKTTNQVFKAGKGSNGLCPKSGKLSGEFTTTSSGETIEAELTS